MAYINPQVEIDLERFKRRDEQIDNAVNAFSNGMSKLEENRRRALENNKATAKEVERAGALGVTPTEQEVAELKETGMSESLSKRLAEPLKAIKDKDLAIAEVKNRKIAYEAEQLGKPLEERDSYKQAMNTAAARNEMYFGRSEHQEKKKIDAENRAEQRKIEDESRKLQLDAQKQMRDAQIQDFEIANPNVIPSSKDSEEVKKLNAANKTFGEAGNRAIGILGSLDWKDKTGLTSRYKDLEQSVTEMRLQAKELANLGVLNGPDLNLVDQTLGSVSVKDLNMYGPEEASKRIKAAIETSNQKLQNAAASRGYKSKSAQPVQKYNPEDEAAINWAKSNPNDPRAAQILQLHGVK